jgi:7-keto-8-aminopelargonate synthetase-like enzyme
VPCRNVGRYRDGLRARGFRIPDGETPIVPIVHHTPELTFAMTRHCQDAGLLVLPVVYPAVPVNAPRLRTSVTASLRDEDVDFALDVLEGAARRTGLIG